MLEDDLIVPPPAVRTLLEKAAHAVAKMPALEDKLAQKHATDPRFTFLRPSDPYHAYYQATVNASRASPAVRGAAASPAVPPATSAAAEAASAEAAEAGPASAPAVAKATALVVDPATAPPGALAPAPDAAPAPYAAPATLAASEAPTSTPLVLSERAVPTNGEAATPLPPPPSPPAPPFLAPEAKTVVAPAVSKLSAAKLRSVSERPIPDRAPSPDRFSVLDSVPPPGLLSLDVMKLVAQCCARDGRDFVLLLGEKEVRNPLFDFLKPLHPHNAVFQRLLNAYTAILERRFAADDEAPASLLRGDLVKSEALANFWYRHDWQELKSSGKEGGQGNSVSPDFSGGAIDWHDFIVLETVDLDETEVDLPAPLADPTQIPRVMAAADSMRLEKARNTEGVDMELDMDDGDAAVEAISTHASRVEAVVVTADVDTDIPSGSVRKVHADMPSHQSKFPVASASAAAGASSQRPEKVRLPDGQVVPLTDATPAMHAQLIDPKYKEERLRASAKNLRQNLADGDQVALQLARLNKSKPDSGVFNRGDLQASLVERTRGAPAAHVELPEAVQSGPALPGKGDEKERPQKKARVEAALGALTHAATSNDVAVPSESKQSASGGDALGRSAVSRDANGLLSEEVWLARVGEKVAIVVAVPEHGNKDWVLEGQKIELEVPLRSTVQRLKEVLSRQECTKVPANKQKLYFEGAGFLSNRSSLASYNIPAGATISLEVKERGGKKKAS